MGGCRCSYKNCRVKSDGKTHMFHYPVFDKVRCHQWITNAQKLEFLNLKLSQLKNRVVCQHHFKDDLFMNFKKDKLTFEAVPTEDGPYCDSTALHMKAEQDMKDGNVYSISLEDIENDYQPFIDKKANFSIKYGDFLTNGDLMDMSNLNQSDTTNTTTVMQIEQPTYIVLNDNIRTHNPNVVPMELNEIHLNPVNEESQNKKNDDTQTKTSLNSKQQSDNNQNVKKDRRIVILSHKKITDPDKIPLPSKVCLQPISTSVVLPLPKKKRDVNSNASEEGNVVMKGENEYTIVQNTPNYIKIEVPQADKQLLVNAEMPPIVIERQVPDSHENLIQNQIPDKAKSDISKIQNASNKTRTNTRSVLKKVSSLTPEKIATIQEKRKFNMKLRDIIESCLDKLEDQDKTDENVTVAQEPRTRKANQSLKVSQKTVTPSQLNFELVEEHKEGTNERVVERNENIKNRQVAAHLSQSSENPGVQEYAISFLEARMKKMEENLMKKIDQNTMRIMELKKSSQSKPDSRSAQSQTHLPDEAYKKQLYQEISKFLSPETNSLIFEELFINKFAKKANSPPPEKRRRWR